MVCVQGRLILRMNCSGPQEPTPGPAEPRRALLSCLLALLLLPAAAGNLLLLLTSLRSRETELRGPRERRASGVSGGPGYCFTLSLSVSDLALSVSVLPSALYCTAAGVTELSTVWCEVSGFLLVLLFTSSLHARLWTSVVQFWQLRHALSNSRLWTSCKIRVLVLLLWFYSISNASLPVLGVGKYRYSSARALCSLSLVEPDEVSRAITLWWLSISMATPLILTCVLQGYVVHVARRQAKRGTFRCNETHCFYVPATVYEKSSKALLLGTGSLLLCWTPFLSVSLYEGVSLVLAPVWVSQGCVFLVLSSCAVSPGVTCLTQSQFRSAAGVTMSHLLQHFSLSNPTPRPNSSNQICTTRTSLPGALHITS